MRFHRSWGSCFLEGGESEEVLQESPNPHPFGAPVAKHLELQAGQTEEKEAIAGENTGTATFLPGPVSPTTSPGRPGSSSNILFAAILCHEPTPQHTHHGSSLLYRVLCTGHGLSPHTSLGHHRQ